MRCETPDDQHKFGPKKIKLSKKKIWQARQSHLLLNLACKILSGRLHCTHRILQTWYQGIIPFSDHHERNKQLFSDAW